MGHVLILDSDSAHAAELVRELQTASCRTTMCSERQDAMDILRKQQIDIVILVSNPAVDWKSSAKWLYCASRHLQNPPQIVCVIRTPYQGPSERLYGARHGVRVIYENK
jgi:DNA-binding response OmpR family regulator